MDEFANSLDNPPDLVNFRGPSVAFKRCVCVRTDSLTKGVGGVFRTVYQHFSRVAVAFVDYVVVT